MVLGHDGLTYLPFLGPMHVTQLSKRDLHASHSFSGPLWWELFSYFKDESIMKCFTTGWLYVSS